MTDQQIENLFCENEFFILRTARIAAGRPITKSDDEWSVALSAFWEALKSHDTQKGTLQAYASVVIRHRLIDYVRSVKTRERELSAQPAVFGGDVETETVGIQRAVERSLIQEVPDTALADEIDELAELLKRYNINFLTFPNAAPRQERPGASA